MAREIFADRFNVALVSCFVGDRIDALYAEFVREFRGAPRNFERFVIRLGHHQHGIDVPGGATPKVLQARLHIRDGNPRFVPHQVSH